MMERPKKDEVEEDVSDVLEKEAEGDEDDEDEEEEEEE